MVLGVRVMKAIDPLIPEILSRADKTPDIAVGQDAERASPPSVTRTKPLFFSSISRIASSTERPLLDTGDLRAADHDVADLGPESGAEASAGMKFEKILFLEIPPMDQRDGEGVSHRQGGRGARCRCETEGAGLSCPPRHRSRCHRPGPASRRGFP